MRKKISIMLVLTLVLSMITSIPLASFAADAAYSDLNNVKKVNFESSDNVGIDYFNDDLFTTDPTVYDPHLAVTSVIAASSTCNSHRYTDESEKYQKMSKNAYEYLEDCGFSDVYINEDYRVKPDGTKAPTICAHKKINDNGKEYTLLAVFPKSGALEAEFYNVMRASHSEKDKGDYAYFYDTKEKSLKAARDYIEEFGIEGDLKVWIAGYSRGGGVANLMAGEIVDDPVSALGSRVNVANSDIYCYTFSPYRSAVNTRDLDAERYDVIHNIISDSDIVIRMPNELMSFGWFGQVHDLRDGVNAGVAFRLMEVHSESDYESYINGGDPNSFSPKKLDIKALLKGQLSLADDEESYLPHDQGQFLDGVMKSLVKMFNEDGGDVREEYYKNYQDPFSDFIKYYKSYGIPDAGTILETPTAIPFVLSTYISFLAERNAENNAVKNAEINAAIESAFNALADKIEDENGNLSKDVARLKTTDAAYKLLRRLYFTENTDIRTDLNGIPQKYSLKRKITVDENFEKAIKKISARLYTMTLNDILTAQGVDSALISAMTTEEAGSAMSHALSHALFDNEYQSSSVRPLDPNNEQFKHLATLIGNTKSYDTLHYIECGQAWVEAACDLYYDYEGFTDSQLSGYRRVYINQPEGVDVAGIVRAEDGSALAIFKNGKMLSRKDGWIGYTKSDTGGWLRLPLNNSYTVDLKVSKDSKLNIRLAEYSVYDGKIARTVTGDSKYNWAALDAYKDGAVSLNVPAVEEGDSGYALPSTVDYSVSVSGSEPVPGSKTQYSSSVPKIKKVKAKAGKKSLTVSWKKHSAKQRAKFTRTEVQYSTSKNFSTYKIVNVSKAKASYKIKGLRAGKKYYVRVRNARKTSTVKYVSKWSAVKKAKVK